MTLKDKLHKILFPKIDNAIMEILGKGVQLKETNEMLKGSVVRMGEENQKVRDDLKAVQETRDKYFNELKEARLKIVQLERVPVPTMEELMRFNLQGEKIHFATADPKSGLIPHFLDMTDKDTRTKYVTQLYQISQMEGFHAMIKFHIDDLANHAFRSADEKQRIVGQAGVNGVCLIRNDVEMAREDFEESHKNEDDFDKFEVGSGVT